MLCPNCGTEVGDQMSLCRQCAGAMRAAREEAEPDSANEEGGARRSVWIPIGIFGFGFALVAIGLVMAFVQSHP